MSTGTPRVDACIEAVSKRFPSLKSTAYFEEAHQHITPLARDLEREMSAVRDAVLTYYDALSARQHGGVAQDRAFNAIEQALGLSWQPGVDHRATAVVATPAALRFSGARAGRPRTAEEAACWCSTCRPVTMDDCRMVLCPTCGNKRCPRADDHRNVCGKSNAPGQVPVRETPP